MKDKTFVGICAVGVALVLLILASTMFSTATPTAMAVKDVQAKPSIFGGMLLIAVLASIIVYHTWRK